MRNILVIALSLFSVVSFGQTLQDTVKVQPLSEFPEISLVSGDGTVIPVQFIRNDSSLWGRVDKDDLKTFILANIGAIGDVLITSPTDSSILIYDQANSRWVDAPYPSISGGSGVSDGVITGASYNAGTQNIDVTVASPGTSFSFSVAGLLDNTDTQDLTLVSNTLSLTDGGSVDLSVYLDNTDDQTAAEVPVTSVGNLSSTDVQAALVELQTDIDGIGAGSTDDQTLSLVGNTLGIEDGNSVDLSIYLDNTDTQDLSLSGNTLSLTGDATSVDISGISVSWNNLTDIPAGFADNVDNVSSEGTGDGVTTSGLYNAVTEAIDFTVTGAADYSVSVSSLLDNTDDQTIDVFAFDGTNLTLSLEGDGEATKSIDLSSLSTNTTYDFIQLNTAFVNDDFSIGEIGWGENDEVRIGILDNYDFAVGQDMYKTVHNTTASAIPAGTAVMMTGADGNSSVFTIAPMNYPAIGAEYLIGVTAVDIAAGGTGVAVQNGNVRGLDVDAAGWSAGDVLYLDEVSAGGLTTTPGDVLVAAVTSAGPNGSIYVRPDFYAGLSQAEADAVGAMVSGNTETLIDVTYQADNTIDFVVNDDLSLYDNTTSGFLTAEVDGSITNEIQDLQSVTDQGATTTNIIEQRLTTADGIRQYSNTSSAIWRGPINLMRRSGGDYSTPTAALNTYTLGGYYFEGYNSGNAGYISSSAIKSYATADYTTANSNPTRLVFEINNNNGSTLYPLMTLNSNLRVGIKQSNPLFALDVNGTVGFPAISDGSSFDQILARNSTTGEVGFTTDQTGTDDQTLQEVTDLGATTTNDIVMSNSAIDFSGNSDSESQFITGGTSLTDLNLRMPISNGWNVTTFQRESNGVLNAPTGSLNNANTLLSFEATPSYGHQLAFLSNSNFDSYLWYRQQYNNAFGDWERILTTNDFQDLSLTDNTLSLTGDATTVDLSSYLDNTDDQQIFFNSETNILSIQDANFVDLSPLASGGGLSWDDQTEVLYAEALTIPATTFTDPTYANSRNFHAVLNTLNLSNATLELPTPSATYEKYYIAVTCIDGGTGFCRVTNTGTAASPVTKTMSNNDRAYLLCHKIDDIGTYAWTMTETFAALPESQTLSWSAGTDRNDEITLSDGGGTITVTDDQQLSWNSLTNVLSLTNSATADLNDLLQGIIVSGNSVVIQGGPAGANALPIVNTVESVTSGSTTAAVDLEGAYNRIAQIDMTSAGPAVTLSVSNPVTGGVYTFHFQSVSSTDLAFPGTFLDAAGSTLGTVSMAADNWYTCYYDGSNYHCK